MSLDEAEEDYWGSSHVKRTKQIVNIFDDNKKEEFLKQRLAEKEMSGDAKNKKSLTPEEMSEFYKKFLDENYRSHIKYNKEWYKKNISLLWPALQVNVIRSIAWWRNKT